jgi:hypothetical protein
MEKTPELIRPERPHQVAGLQLHRKALGGPLPLHQLPERARVVGFQAETRSGAQHDPRLGGVAFDYLEPEEHGSGTITRPERVFD